MAPMEYTTQTKWGARDQESEGPNTPSISPSTMIKKSRLGPGITCLSHRTSAVQAHSSKNLLCNSVRHLDKTYCGELGSGRVWDCESQQQIPRPHSRLGGFLF